MSHAEYVCHSSVVSNSQFLKLLKLEFITKFIQNKLFRTKKKNIKFGDKLEEVHGSEIDVNNRCCFLVQFSLVQSLSRVQLFATP